MRDSVKHEYLDLGRRATDAEIVEGLVATHGIGSDAYPEVIVEVRRFKSGAKAGLVREIVTVALRQRYDEETRTFADTYTAVERRKGDGSVFDHGTESVYSARYDEPRREGDPVRYRPVGSKYGGLAPGYARDYRDPSF